MTRQLQLVRQVESSETGRCDLVVKTLTGLSRNRIRGLFDHFCVRVNGQICTELGTPVRAGDRVEVTYDPNQGYKPKRPVREDRAFSLVYEDAQLLVVEKAAGVLTVPSERGESNTLVERVAAYLGKGQAQRRVHLVHRLDREVSGLLVIAKSETVARALIEQFQQHKPERRYAALVAGHVRGTQGTLKTFLATKNNLDRYSAPESAETELAITHYAVKRTWPDATYLDVRLETGRRHQIRVHLAEAGHPVLGDPRYGRGHADHPHWPHRRLALHAQSLAFEHPTRGELLRFETQLPAELTRFLQQASSVDRAGAEQKTGKVGRKRG